MGYDNGLTNPDDGFDQTVRTTVQEFEEFTEQKLKRYALYPLDSGWCYWTATPPLWNRARPSLVAQQWAGNRFLIVRMFAERAKEGPPATITGLLPDYHLLRPNAVAIPFRVKPKEPEDDGHHGRVKAREDINFEPTANLSANSRQYLTSLGVENVDDNSDVAALIWRHSTAICYSPLYRRENHYGVRYNWPRIPFPANSEALFASAGLGALIETLLDTDTEPPGVTTGNIRPELSAIGPIAGTTRLNIDPAQDLVIDVGWGHPGKAGETVMPGKGLLIEREHTNQEREAISRGAEALGLPPDQAFQQLGRTTFDVFLNARAYWKNIPKGVWDYHVGGYRVIKKWLSYRESRLLSRAITADEARWVTSMARRIASICLLQPELDANYLRVRRDTYKWPIV